MTPPTLAQSFIATNLTPWLPDTLTDLSDPVPEAPVTAPTEVDPFNGEMPTPTDPALNSDLESDTNPDPVDEIFSASPAADPLNSPYPVPWEWILHTQADYASQQRPGLRYYRTPALVSPSGEYAAYSRIEVRAGVNLYDTRVLSVLFLENLKTGKLQVIRAESPISRYLQQVGEDSEEMAGVISVLIPASWSGNGDRLLARQMEGAFNSSDISDYAVVWSSQTGTAETLIANPDPSLEASATLLGWYQENPNQVLFRVSYWGEEEPDDAFVRVSLGGGVQAALAPDVINYGQLVSRSWTGAQAIQ